MTTSRRHVLVTDASRGSAVAFIRSLGRRGWRVTAADSHRGSAGFRSRYTTDRLVYPDPTRKADAAVAAILDTVRRDRVDLVVPVTDEIGLPLARAREELAGQTCLALPDAEGQAIAHDKVRTLALAARLEVPIPPTVSVSTADEAVAAA